MIERLDVLLDDDSLGLGPTTKVGLLSCERGRTGEVISFEYDDEYLALPRSVQIDPELPLCPVASATPRQTDGDACCWSVARLWKRNSKDAVAVV
jgi:hypothetical protein